MRNLMVFMAVLALALLGSTAVVPAEYPEDCGPGESMKVDGNVNATSYLVEGAYKINAHYGMELHGTGVRPVQIPDASLLVGYDQTGSAYRGTGNVLISGNVGIGTDDPQAKLDVRGVIHADDIEVEVDGEMVSLVELIRAVSQRGASGIAQYRRK